MAVGVAATDLTTILRTAVRPLKSLGNYLKEYRQDLGEHSYTSVRRLILERPQKFSLIVWADSLKTVATPVVAVATAA